MQLLMLETRLSMNEVDLRVAILCALCIISGNKT